MMAAEGSDDDEGGVEFQEGDIDEICARPASHKATADVLL